MSILKGGDWEGKKIMMKYNFGTAIQIKFFQQNKMLTLKLITKILE